MFKVNNKDTRTTCSIVSIVNFEQKNAGYGKKINVWRTHKNTSIICDICSKSSMKTQKMVTN